MRARMMTVLGSTLLGVALACGGQAVQADPLAAAGRSGTKADSSSSICNAPLPSAALAVPAGNELDFQLDAIGVQIYTCTANATGAGWVFTAPEATLYNAGGIAVGSHYAGPTWEAKDGSTVVGAKVAGFAPDPASIPWLLLKAVSHGGDGRMSEVTFVQRLGTNGGIAPASGCDATTVGAVARVPYTATYCFSEAAE